MEKPLVELIKQKHYSASSPAAQLCRYALKRPAVCLTFFNNVADTAETIAFNVRVGDYVFKIVAPINKNSDETLGAQQFQWLIKSVKFVGTAPISMQFKEFLKENNQTQHSIDNDGTQVID